MKTYSEVEKEKKMRVLWVDPNIDKDELKRLRSEFPEVMFSITKTVDEALKIMESVFKIDVLIIEILSSSPFNKGEASDHVKTVGGATFISVLKLGRFEPLSRKDIPVIVYTSIVGLLSFEDIRRKNTSYKLFDLERDFTYTKELGFDGFVEVVRKALEKAKMQPGEVRIL